MRVLLFEFMELPAIMAAAAALGPLGAEVTPVSRRQYQCSLAALAEGEGETSARSSYQGVPLGGRMVVFCGTEGIEPMLVALRQAGVGPECLKAVLTPHNRRWTPPELFNELSREHQMMQRGR